MKSEIKTYMRQVDNEANQRTQSGSGTHSLNSKMIAKIGHHFTADYILRGRILEYKTRDGSSWSPSRKGFLPVVFEGIGRSVFGYTNSSTYDDRHSSFSMTHGPLDGQGAVQMRMWVQEAATGNVIWSNRIRVQVSPESVVADNQYDTLFNTAIEQGVTVLVDHFVTYGL